MSSRLTLCIVVLICVASGAAFCQTAEPVLEPGLSSRIASFAILKLPSMTRQSFIPVEWQVVERLQTLPVLPPADHAEQLKLIFAQVKDNVASPELLASAARAVVALSMPAGDASESWVGFRTGVALRSQLSDVNLGTVPVVADPLAFAGAVKKAGEELKSQVLEATTARDGARLTELRRKTVSAVTRDIVAVWLKLLELQAPPAPATASAAETTSPQESGSAVEASTAPAEAAPAAAPVRKPAPSGPVSYVGNRVSMKFHRAGCNFGPGPKNSVPLRSRDDAVRQGFDPCKVCRP